MVDCDILYIQSKICTLNNVECQLSKITSLFKHTDYNQKTICSRHSFMKRLVQPSHGWVKPLWMGRNVWTGKKEQNHRYASKVSVISVTCVYVVHFSL